MAKWLIIIVCVLGALWGGWWFVGSTAAREGSLVLVEEARASGWDIAYDDLGVAGFPNRFDTTVTAPMVTTPDGLITWSAPFFQVFALAYRPNHIIAVAPNQMVFELPGRQVEVRSDDLRASVILTVSTEPDLDRFTATAEGLDIIDPQFGLTAGNALMAARRTEVPGEMDVAFSMTDVGLNDWLRSLIDPGRGLPGRIDALTFEARLPGLADGGAGPLAEDIDALLSMGDLRLAVTGALATTASGAVDGALELRIRGWEPLLDTLVAIGAIGEGQVAILNGGLNSLRGDDGMATVPVTIAAGQIRVLGLPLGSL